LEKPADLDNLFAVLLKYRGGDGRHPVFQSNYVLSSPDYQGIAEWEYKTYKDLVIPDVPSLWERGDFIAKAKEGIKKGIWYPEYHGNTHFNRFVWEDLIKRGDKATLEGFRHQIFVNGKNIDNLEYDKKLSFKQQSYLLDIGISRYRKIFGYEPRSFVGPNYTWQLKTERALAERGIRAVQAKNRQRDERAFWEKIRGKVLDLLGKRSADKPWHITMGDYNPKLGIFYLIRNVDFEPRGKKDTETKSGAEEAYESIIAAWQKNGPAIVNTHRINYVYLDKRFVAENIRQLDWLLNKIQNKHPDAIYLTDWEVVQLYEDSTSVLAHGDITICRNFAPKKQTFRIKIPEDKEIVYIKDLKTNTRIPFTFENDMIVFTVAEGHYGIQLR
ncbi:MAG: hypothetical protein OEW69_11875, partial [Nitrospirota bacterium]|nr:hypothetical protein [Nitrospirota bacterium]